MFNRGWNLSVFFLSTKHLVFLVKQTQEGMLRI